MRIEILPHLVERLPTILYRNLIVLERELLDERLAIGVVQLFKLSASLNRNWL